MLRADKCYHFSAQRIYSDNRVRYEKKFRTISIQCPVLKKGLLFASLHVEINAPPLLVSSEYKKPFMIFIYQEVWLA